MFNSVGKQRYRWALAIASFAVLVFVANIALDALAQDTANSASRGASDESLFEAAILGKVDSRATAKALWLLFQRGKEVKAPRSIWLHGPVGNENKVEIENLFALQDCRLSKLNEVQYVFYGSREAKQYLYLLHVRTYPDDKPRFVILACATITPEAGNDPGIKFDHLSVWDMAEPHPAE